MTTEIVPDKGLFVTTEVGFFTKSILDAQTIPPTYVQGASVDLTNAKCVSLIVKVGVPTPGEVATLKFLWSDDASVWVAEPVLVSGTATTTEQPYTPLDRVVEIDLSDDQRPYGERFNRLKRYFTVAVKSNAVLTTTATVSVSANLFTN